MIQHMFVMTIKKGEKPVPKDKEPAMSSEEMKNVRKVLEVTQVELSSLMNLAPQTIAKWEGTFPGRVNDWRRLFILLAAKAYQDGNLSKYGELSEDFVHSIMKRNS